MFPMLLQHFLASVQILGLMALCTIGYRHIQAKVIQDIPRHFLIGSVMGAGAIVSMIQPFGIFDHIQLDGRNIFVAISFAVAGPYSAAITAIYACLFSYFTNGTFIGSAMSIGVTVVTSILAAIWAYVTRGTSRHGILAWVILGLIVSRPLIMDILFWHFIPPLAIALPAITNFLAVMIFGRLFEAEMRRGRRERLLDAAAHTDSLTGLSNRRALMQYMKDIPSQKNEGYLVLIVDIDHFKKINDTYGHDVGDAVLVTTAARMKNSIRDSDFIARLGGEEFFILIHMTPDESGQEIIERLRQAISSPVAAGPHQLSVTVSIGALNVQTADLDFMSIYSRIDSALYEAKRLGRNRVIFAT